MRDVFAFILDMVFYRSNNFSFASSTETTKAWYDVWELPYQKGPE